MTHGICSLHVCIGGENVTQPGNPGRQKEERAIFPSSNWLSVPKKFTQLFESPRRSIALLACIDTRLRTLPRLRMPLKHLNIQSSHSFQKFTLEHHVCQKTLVDEVSRAHSLSPPSPYVWKRRLSKLFVRKAVGPGWEPSSPCSAALGECKRIGKCHREREYFSSEGCWKRTQWEERWLLGHS